MLPTLDEPQKFQLTSSSSSTPVQKRKRKHYEDVRQLIGAAAKRLEGLGSKVQQQDDIHTFAMSVAEELRKIKDTSRLRAVKRTIFNCLMDAQDKENVQCITIATFTII
ncbi:hypothetical protein RN001_003727 [Aquatica leii]|uniref:Uncharacterized protein n=1 Tax=Aquatica leii TaxID=1421715 RepID=A0AAN7PP59_9COLE|nr:hypothetical protein RN001_003727 [Aquatica leii]